MGMAWGLCAANRQMLSATWRMPFALGMCAANSHYDGNDGQVLPPTTTGFCTSSLGGQSFYAVHSRLDDAVRWQWPPLKQLQVEDAF